MWSFRGSFGNPGNGTEQASSDDRRRNSPAANRLKVGSAISKKETPSKRVFLFLEAPPGLEPGNRGFAVRCLTTWLWRHISLAGGTRKMFGAGNEARTRYLHLGKVALYRMS